MNRLALAAALPFALLACSSGGEGGEEKAQNAQPPQPVPTGPPPKTPVMQVTPAAGPSPAWLEPQPSVNSGVKAPYGNLNDDPVVNAAPAQ